MTSELFEYPPNLNILFEKLYLHNITPIIVGGYVRDKFLNLDSKDIDIELYGVNSLEDVEKILNEFGELNSVGRSFGVCKLKFYELDLDFSLPREDSKISQGHRGFEITIDSSLDFTTASSRRDFKMNAIGFDVKNRKILDPHNGLKDIQTKTISAVDITKFSQDPLRVLRGVQFASRFDFKIDRELFDISKEMIMSNILEELPKERLYEEIKKLLLKSKKPSIGFKLLRELNSDLYLKEFEPLLDSLDYLAQLNIDSTEKKLTLMFSLLSLNFKDNESLKFAHKLTEKQTLLKNIEIFTKLQKTFILQNSDDVSIHRLSMELEVESFLYLLEALFLEETKEIKELRKRAVRLDILHKKADALIQGRDLIKLGLKPSIEFSKILKEAYSAQIHKEFTTKEEALLWIKNI